MSAEIIKRLCHGIAPGQSWLLTRVRNFALLNMFPPRAATALWCVKIAGKRPRERWLNFSSDAARAFEQNLHAHTCGHRLEDPIHHGETCTAIVIKG